MSKLQPVDRHILTGPRRFPIVWQIAGERRFMLFTNILHTCYLIFCILLNIQVLLYTITVGLAPIFSWQYGGIMVKIMQILALCPAIKEHSTIMRPSYKKFALPWYRQ